MSLMQSLKELITPQYRNWLIEMALLNRMKKIVKMTDFFYSSEMLRYEDELQYRTLTGGVLSLGIIVTILIGFASMIMDTINLTSITTQMEVIKRTDPSQAILSTAPGSNFMFGVEIWRLNLTGQRRYFDIRLKLLSQSGGAVINQTYYPLERCTRQHWADYPSVLENFDSLSMDGWLCPEINFEFPLFGKYSSSSYSQYIINVSACTNDSDLSRPCASNEQIDQLFKSTNFFFYFTYYYINPVINSDQKEYKSYYLEDQSYVIFGDTLGSETFIYFTDYTIITDNSIWPFKNVQEDRGCIVESLAINHPFQTNRQGVFVTLNMAKSANSLVYNRSVQKISSVFSFMGGMIGAVSAVLFIIKIYTRLSFQISIAFEIFRPEEQSQTQYLDMNFWTFLKYNLYRLGKLFGFPLVQSTLDYIEECQDQILKQLDIKSIIKRIIFIEHCLTYIFSDCQLDGLQLKKPTSARQIRRIRQKCSQICNDSNQNRELAQLKCQIVNKESLDDMVSISPTFFAYPSNPCMPTRMKISGGQQWREKTEQSLKKKSAQMIDNIIQKHQMSEQTFEKQVCIRKRRSKVTPFKTVYLRNLYNQAFDGDHISKRIWHSLSQDIRNKVLSETIIAAPK